MYLHGMRIMKTRAQIEKNKKKIGSKLEEMKKGRRKIPGSWSKVFE